MVCFMLPTICEADKKFDGVGIIGGIIGGSKNRKKVDGFTFEGNQGCP